MTKGNWEAMKKELPETSHEVLKLISDAYESTQDDPARAVVKSLREQLAGLKTRFEKLKGGDK